MTIPFNDNIFRIVLSSPAKDSKYTRAEILAGQSPTESTSNEQQPENIKFQANLFTKTQVFHKNLESGEVLEFVQEMLGTAFMQYTAWDGKREYAAKVTKKGKLLTTSKVMPTVAPTNFTPGSFNKQKKHVIQEGEKIPVLVDMGVFTKDYKIAKYDKFQQINRFIELIADQTKTLAPGTIVNVIDFGCGKSYLTFLVYYYFAVRLGTNVNICGLDLKEDVIDNCNAASQKYGYADNGLHFVKGDIGTQAAPPLTTWGCDGSFNIVISLHACDTATDHAIFNAIKWGASLIMAVPCCQHELRNQIKPKTLNILSTYGIIEERFAALATDAIRANLLKYAGYNTQIIEFAPFESTAKNLMIRAKKKTQPNSGKPHDALEAVKKLQAEFGFAPALLRLLEETFSC